jgi:hypothetical protein
LIALEWNRPSFVALPVVRRHAAIDNRKSQIVEMRFFGDLGIEETAEALGVSENRQAGWTTAKLWLLEELTSDGD